MAKKGGTIKKLDLSSATSATVRTPVVQLTGKEKAGVNLTWGMLVIISVFLFFMFLTILLSPDSTGLLEEFKKSALPGSDSPVSFDTYVGFVEQQRATRRAFELDIIDKVLVNVLLPVLTALLGYIFGTSTKGSSGGGGND